MCELGEERICDKCGKRFYIPLVSLWTYKTISFDKKKKEAGKIKYFCKYTCMTAWQREYEAMKKNGQLHRSKIQPVDDPGDKI